MSTEPTADDLADLEDTPELVPVIVQVHNGLVIDGQPMFVPSVYEVPINELWEVQKRWAAFEIPT